MEPIKLATPHDDLRAKVNELVEAFNILAAHFAPEPEPIPPEQAVVNPDAFGLYTHPEGNL